MLASNPAASTMKHCLVGKTRDERIDWMQDKAVVDFAVLTDALQLEA